MKMKRLLITAMFVLFGSQASAWVSKGFKPNKVSQIAIVVQDDATNGCWTNIGEVKRYAEDKLELAGFEVFRGAVEGFLTDGNRFLFRITVNATRIDGLCYGDIKYGIATLAQVNKIVGVFLVAESIKTISEAKNVNEYTLDRMGIFMKEIENPQWDPTQ